MRLFNTIRWSNNALEVHNAMSLQFAGTTIGQHHYITEIQCVGGAPPRGQNVWGHNAAALQGACTATPQRYKYQLFSKPAIQWSVLSRRCFSATALQRASASTVQRFNTAVQHCGGATMRLRGETPSLKSVLNTSRQCLNAPV